MRAIMVLDCHRCRNRRRRGSIVVCEHRASAAAAAVNLVGDVCEMPMASQKCPGLTRLCKGPDAAITFRLHMQKGEKTQALLRSWRSGVATYDRVPLLSARILVVGSCGCIAALSEHVHQHSEF